MTLHNQNGALVKRISNLYNVGEGEFEQCIDMHDLVSGTYLIAIATDRGEQVVQRLTVIK
jgi:hypothetical protein